MYNENLTKIAQTAKFKADMVKNNLLRYIVFSMMAGFYLGIGNFVAYNITAPFSAVNSPFTKTMLGLPFAIALILIVFAGGELFTGNIMYMTVGFLKKDVSAKDILRVWGWSFAGNLLGGILFSLLIYGSGYLTNTQTADLIILNSTIKMNAPAINLFCKAILCNILVCLALWSGSRTNSDVARMILIFMCLFTFVNSGYEHSVANMSLLLMALLTGSTDVSLAGYTYNMLIVTVGNIIGGGLFVAAAYWYVSGIKKNA